jgi:anti-anti-sigma regulatory factor
MSIDAQNRQDESPSFQAAKTAPPIASLVVRLHRDANNCTASFIGSMIDTTRVTIDGLVDLLAGEASVVLDFCRIDVVDYHGADAVRALIDSVRARGADLLIVDPDTAFATELTERPGPRSTQTEPADSPPNSTRTIGRNGTPWRTGP